MSGYWEFYCGGCGIYFQEEGSNQDEALKKAEQTHRKNTESGIICRGYNLGRGPVFFISEERQRRELEQDLDDC